MHQGHFGEKKEFSFKSLFTPLTTLKAIHWIVIFGFLVYGNALFNEFVWDDIPQVVNYQLYHSIFNIGYIFLDHSLTYYRPLPAIVMSGMYTLFGPTVFWYHLVQIILHIINTSVIYIIFKRFINRNIAFVLSLVFLVHPINVESVAYISSLQIILSMTFGLFVFILGFYQKNSVMKKSLLCFLLLLCSLLSKETGIIFVILFIPFLFFTTQKFSRKEFILLTSSIFMALLGYILLRFFITTTPITTNFSASPVPIMQASLYERLITLPKILLFYIQTFFYPKDLAIAQNWLVKTIDSNNFVIPLFLDSIFFILIFFPVVYFAIKQKKQLFPYIFFLVWFLLSWVIHWNVIPLDMTVADRWFYFAEVGLLGLLGIIVDAIGIKKSNSKPLVLSIAVAIILLLSLRTIVRNHNWNSPLLLYEHDSKISTDSYELENAYAYHLLLAKRYDEALPHLKKSVQLAPGYWTNWDNFGVYYEGKGQIDKSIDAFNQAIKNNKYYYHAYISLGNIYFYYKSPQAAKGFLDNAVLAYPNDPQLLLLSAVTEYKLGNKETGMDKIMKAYSISNNQNLLKIYSEMQQNVVIPNLLAPGL